MIIFSNEVTDSITEFQYQLYDGTISFGQYLEKSLEKLHFSLKEYFGTDNYIFGKVYFLGQLEQFDFNHIEFYNDEENPENQIFSHGIKLAESLVKEQKATSLSIILINRFLRGIILHKGNVTPEDIPGIHYYNYKDDIAKFFAKLKKGNNENFEHEYIEPIIAIHRRMAEECSSEIYSYLLRTRNLDNDYNGSLYLVLNRGVSVYEYSQIADFFSFIMYARIKYEYKKEILNRTVIDELSHSWKHTFGALKTHIEQIAGNVLIGEDVNLNYHIQKARVQVSSLNKRNQFLLNLMRAGANAENLKNLEKENRKNSLSCEQVSIKSLLQLVAETLQFSTLELGLTLTEHRELVENKCVPSLIEKLKNLKEIKVDVMATGLELVLEDLLKNAVFNTHYQNPDVNVHLNEPSDGKTLELHITNNTEISDEYCDFINQDRNAEGVAKQYKAGIRTVKRIITYPIFNASRGGWKIQCLKSNGWTDIFLVIPKSDIKK